MQKGRRMEVYEAIERRRTIRIFTKGVSEEQLRKIILAGTKPPSGWNCQPWEFIIVDDQKIIDQLAELKYQLLKGRRIRNGEGQNEIEERALNQKKSFKNASIVALCVKSGPESQSIWWDGNPVIPRRCEFSFGYTGISLKEWDIALAFRKR
jgi:nitroreductase